MYYKRKLMILALVLTSCKAEDRAISECKGVSYAKAVKAEIHSEYLACYALGKIEKKECINQLTNRYIHHKWQENKEYIKAFQFESEKLGFKNFLNDRNLSCKSIKNGPTYDPNKEAYLVKCKPNHQYFMQYDYDTKKWYLISGGHNND